MDGWVGAWGPRVSGGSDGEWVLGVYCYGNRSRLGVVVAGGAGIRDPGSRWWSLVVTADQGPGGGAAAAAGRGGAVDNCAPA